MTRFLCRLTASPVILTFLIALAIWVLLNTTYRLAYWVLWGTDANTTTTSV